MHLAGKFLISSGMRMEGFNEEHCLYKTRPEPNKKATSKTKTNKKPTRECSSCGAGLSVGSLGASAALEVVWGLPSPLASEGLLCFATTVSPLDWETPFLSWKMRLLCFLLFWWGYWESGPGLKQILLVCSSSSVWGGSGCCKWEPWVDLVEGTHRVTQFCCPRITSLLCL